MMSFAEASAPRFSASPPIAIFAAAFAPPAVAVLCDPRSLHNGPDGPTDDCARRASDNGTDPCADSSAGHVSFARIPIVRRDRQCQHGGPNKHRSVQIHRKTPLFDVNTLAYSSPALPATASRRNSSRFQQVQPQNRRKICMKYAILAFVAWCREW